MSSISSSFADRPPPDPVRFLAALDEWRRGDVTAGTAMQTLKRGGFDLLLASTDAGNVTAAPLRDAWDAWERGKATPGDTLTRLDEAGLAAFLAEVEVAP